MEEAGAGLLREGGRTRAPGEPQPLLRGWEGASAIGLSLLQLRELVWDLKSLQATQTGSRKKSWMWMRARMMRTAHPLLGVGQGQCRFCHQKEGQVWPGEMPSVHSVMERSFALNCMRLSSGPATPSLSFLSGSSISPQPYGYV